MKKLSTVASALGLSALCALITPAHAESDFHLAFEIAGNIGVDNFFEIELDLNLGDRFLAANGVMKASNGLAVPATGTCFFTPSGGAFCNFQVDQDSYTMELSAQLAGTLIAKGANGAILDTAPVRLIASS